LAFCISISNIYEQQLEQIMAESCLGMSFLGHCSYLPDGSGWSILTFGDTIAAIALLLAFSQL